jgi:ribosomal 50S subunit-associated protein YjgA (DUF615 family)
LGEEERREEDGMTQEEMQFIENLFRSLEREMDGRFDQMATRFDAVTARLDQMSARMDRIGGLVNGGGRAIAKMIEWTEKTDVSLADLLRRIQKLEDKANKKGENT